METVRVRARYKYVGDKDWRATYRILCGGPTRKGNFCPAEIGSAIYRAHEADYPDEEPVEEWYLGGDLHAGDDLTYKRVAEGWEDFTVSTLHVDESVADAQRRGTATHRPQRPMPGAMFQRYFQGSGPEPYGPELKFPRSVGEFPVLPATVRCPKCEAVNYISAFATAEEVEWAEGLMREREAAGRELDEEVAKW